MTWGFIIVVVGEMIQRTVDIWCRTSNTINHMANENSEWWVEHCWQTHKVHYTTRRVRKRGACYMTSKILLWKSFKFICHGQCCTSCEHLLGQSVLKTKFNRTRCPDDTKTGHQTFRKQNQWLWTKQEKLKFTSLTISPGTAAAKWFLIMNLLSVQP